MTAALIMVAGVGTASDVAIAMEPGYDGVLLNTASAEAKDDVESAGLLETRPFA